MKNTTNTAAATPARGTDGAELPEVRLGARAPEVGFVAAQRPAWRESMDKPRDVQMHRGSGLTCPMCHATLILGADAWVCIAPSCWATWDLRGLNGRWEPMPSTVELAAETGGCEICQTWGALGICRTAGCATAAAAVLDEKPVDHDPVDVPLAVPAAAAVGRPLGRVRTAVMGALLGAPIGFVGAALDELGAQAREHGVHAALTGDLPGVEPVRGLLDVLAVVVLSAVVAVLLRWLYDRQGTPSRLPGNVVWLRRPVPAGKRTGARDAQA